MKKTIVASIMSCILCFVFNGTAFSARPAGPAALHAVYGAVFNDAPYQSTAFTVSKPDRGMYVITFATPFTSTPSCVAQPNISGDNWTVNCVVVFTATTTNATEVQCTQPLMALGNASAYPLLGVLSTEAQPYYVFPAYGYQGYNGPYQNACTWGNCLDTDFTFICIGN